MSSHGTWSSNIEIHGCVVISEIHLASETIFSSTAAYSLKFSIVVRVFTLFSQVFYLFSLPSILYKKPLEVIFPEQAAG